MGAVNAAILAAVIYAGVIAAGAVVGGYGGAGDEDRVRVDAERVAAVRPDQARLVTVAPTGTSPAPAVQPTSELGSSPEDVRAIRAVARQQPVMLRADDTAIDRPVIRDLTPTDRVRVLTVEQWRATLAFPPEQQYVAARTLICESGGNPRAVGAAGEQGAYQVLARFHGSVPDTLEAQAEQAARIVARESWRPWTTKEGCEQWTR